MSSDRRSRDDEAQSIVVGSIADGALSVSGTAHAHDDDTFVACLDAEVTVAAAPQGQQALVCP